MQLEQDQNRMQVQKIIEKNGIKFIKINKNKFNLTFDINNNTIIIPPIINFDLIQMINTLNPNIFESLDTYKHSEIEITMNSLLKDIFSDLGLPQYYLALRIIKDLSNTNIISFKCIAFDNKLHYYADDVEKIPIVSIYINFYIINNHNVKIDCDVDLTERHNIPQFSEKIIGNIIYNIFYRLKQFIENVSF